MVYCTKCGTENEDDAINCKSCGDPMKETFTPRRYNRRRRDGDLCFGPRGGSWIGLFIGLMIVLAGLSELLPSVSWDRLWPIPVILLGLLIVYNSYTKR